MLRPYVLRGHNVDSCRLWPLVQRQDTRLWIWVWWFESTGANSLPCSAVARVAAIEGRSALSSRVSSLARGGAVISTWVTVSGTPVVVSRAVLHVAGQADTSRSGATRIVSYAAWSHQPPPHARTPAIFDGPCGCEYCAQYHA